MENEKNLLMGLSFLTTKLLNKPHENIVSIFNTSIYFLIILCILLFLIGVIYLILNYWKQNSSTKSNYFVDENVFNVILDKKLKQILTNQKPNIPIEFYDTQSQKCLAY